MSVFYVYFLTSRLHSADETWQVMDTFLVSEMVQVFNDPNPSIPRAPEIRTLRIYISRFDTLPMLIQEYREKSVLNGFAAVGGLWAFIGGFFAWFFGTSLHRVLLGMYAGQADFKNPDHHF